MNVHAIALWASILGGGAAIYFPLHSQHAADQQNEIQRARERQKTIDQLEQRLSNDETAIAAIAAQLPQDKRDLLTAIQAAQKHAQEQPDMVMFDKRRPVAHTEALDCVKTGTCITAADAPKVDKEGPQ